MGLPQLDFRVPEATWFKSAFAGKFRNLPGLSGLPSLGGTGALAWPYKIAVVAVMALVACGTLVTFGSAEAETPSSSQVAALPGSDEASPRVEGQVLPPAQALLNSEDLLSSLNLTDFSPGEGATLSLTDDDDNNSDDSDDSDDSASEKAKKKSSTTKATPKPTTSSPNSDDDSSDAPVEGPKHKQWVEDNAEYQDAQEAYEDAKEALDDWEDDNEKYQDCRKNPLKYMGKNCEKDFNPGPKPTVPNAPQSPGPEPDFES